VAQAVEHHLCHRALALDRLVGRFVIDRLRQAALRAGILRAGGADHREPVHFLDRHLRCGDQFVARLRRKALDQNLGLRAAVQGFEPRQFARLERLARLRTARSGIADQEYQRKRHGAQHRAAKGKAGTGRAFRFAQRMPGKGQGRAHCVIPPCLLARAIISSLLPSATTRPLSSTMIRLHRSNNAGRCVEITSVC